MIPGDSLAVADERLEDGHVDADLGRQLFKQRIARPGQGARSGFRAVSYTHLTLPTTPYV